MKTERQATIGSLTENPILAALLDKPCRTVTDSRVMVARMEQHDDLYDCAVRLLAYQGGLPAEAQSAANTVSSFRQRCKQRRHAVRASSLSRCGSPIDLFGLMRQRTTGGLPIWALVDPREKIEARGNGQHDTDGTFCWRAAQGCKSGLENGTSWLRYAPSEHSHNLKKGFLPAGLPALPAEVRRLLTNRQVTRRATRIGILFQPETWIEVQPDPALVVEWRDLPGEFYCLAVWGGDLAEIMKFID